jgi:hypothetical protein
MAAYGRIRYDYKQTKDGLQSGARQTFALYNNLKVPTTYYVCESYIENATKD